MKTSLLLLLMIPNLCFAMMNLKLDKEKGETEFLAIGSPGFLKINGKGVGPQGELIIDKGMLNGEIRLDLSSLDTGMGLRNQHMKEKYLHVNKYPHALLKIKDQKVPEGWDVTKPQISQNQLQASLNIHGEEKPVTVNYKINEAGQIEADFEINMTDYKVEIPSFMGVTVADKVTVQVQSQLMAKK